ncbi:hypothetical protein ACU20_00285 [Actinobaculum suis]|nr:hypothetical protein ACU20_00285 [Actinobaculum suis]
MAFPHPHAAAPEFNVNNTWDFTPMTCGNGASWRAGMGFLRRYRKCGGRAEEDFMLPPADSRAFTRTAELVQIW